MTIDVPRETRDRLDRLTTLVLEENARQNLISGSTLHSIEHRHIADSLQLLPLLPPGRLLDIGSGGGFPGLVLACARPGPVDLVEPRGLRADFLRRAAEALRLDHVTVHACKVERIVGLEAAAITARAVANLGAIFAMANHCATDSTHWVLPKGRSAQSELAAARETWQGEFELVPSRTDPDAAIVIAHGVRRKGKA